MSRAVRRSGVAFVAAAALALACGPPQEGPSGGIPAHRPPDGLLGDAALQEVVALQAARRGDALAALLGDPRAEVRARAAYALGSVQDPTAVGALAAALDDTVAAVRRDAAFALGQVGTAEAASPLVRALATEGDAEVRRALLAALSRIPTPEAVGALVSAERRAGEEVHRVLALSRLAALRGVASREGQELLLERLDDPDREVRAAAAYYFGRLPDPAHWAPRVARVREALEGYRTDDEAAIHLLHGLGRLGDPGDGPRLRSWLEEGGSWRVRAAAAAALGNLPQEMPNRDALLGALDDPSPQVGLAAAESLGRGTPVPSELQRMKDWISANPERWQAAAPLLSVLARGDEREFVFAWVDALPDGDPFRWGAGLQAVGLMPGQEAVERLRSAATSPDPRIQGAAVSALVQRWAQDRTYTGSAERYFPIFAQVLKGASLQAAFSAAQALGDPLFAPLGSAEALVQAWRTLSAPAQLEPMIAVLESLARTDDPRVVPILREAASHPEPGLRRTARAGLAARGAETGAPGEDPSGAAGARGEVGAPAPSGFAPPDWAYLSALGASPRLRLETERGVVVLRLRTEEAPVTVATVARLAEEGRYDGVPFHRVVPTFVVQGGDVAAGDGFGGPGFTIPSEFTLIPFVRGAVGMASSGKDTEGSQFFITHGDQPHLDGGYTAFGWVEEGMGVVEALMVGDRILRAGVERGR